MKILHWNHANALSTRRNNLPIVQGGRSTFAHDPKQYYLQCHLGDRWITILRPTKRSSKRSESKDDAERSISAGVPMTPKHRINMCIFLVHVVFLCNQSERITSKSQSTVQLFSCFGKYVKTKRKWWAASNNLTSAVRHRCTMPNSQWPGNTRRHFRASSCWATSTE